MGDSVVMFFRTAFSPILSLCLLAAFSFMKAPVSANGSSDGFQALDLRLIGVVQSETQPQALIAAGGIGGETLIGEGDLVGGYTVVSIGEETVEFVKGNQREALSVNGARAVQPRSPKTPLLAFSESEKTPTALEETNAADATLESELADKIIRPAGVKKSVTVQEVPRFRLPIRGGKVSSSFGLRRRPRSVTGLLGSERHEGTDIAAPHGTAVYASAPGTVIEVGRSLVRGRYVIVRHSGGYETRYLHLYRQFVKEGEVIQAGRRIAAEGNTGISTGPHLHFEIRRHGIALDPVVFLPSLRRR